MLESRTRSTFSPTALHKHKRLTVYETEAKPMTAVVNIEESSQTSNSHQSLLITQQVPHGSAQTILFFADLIKKRISLKSVCLPDTVLQFTSGAYLLER